MLSKGVFVSLIGRDLITRDESNKATEKIWLAEVARQVEREVEGRVTSEEEIAAQKREIVALTPKRRDIGASISTKPAEHPVDDKPKL